MCVGLPLRVVRSAGVFADCVDRHGAAHRVDLLLVGEQPPGTWLMTFLGAARAVIDAEEAVRVGSAIDALEALMRGESADLGAAFADLDGREPVLPDFLRGDKT